MVTRRLEFCEIILTEDGILEIIADEGIELNEKHIEQIEQAFLSLVNKPTGLLVNRIHQYSLTHKAQIAISELSIIKAFAFLVYSDLSATVAKFQKIYLNNMCVFTDRDEAVLWLINQ